MPPTPTFRLADYLLKGKLSEFIQERRDTDRSWRLIARDLYDATSGAIDVTPTTLWTWAKDGDANGDAEDAA